MKMIGYFITGLLFLTGLVVTGYNALLFCRDIAVNIDSSAHLTIAITSFIVSAVSCSVFEKIEDTL
jgi:hypothetical protein